MPAQTSCLGTHVMSMSVSFIQEVFHVYLNKFKIAVTHYFSLYFEIIDLQRFVLSPGMDSLHENCS